jgi:peptidyl-tRNA hydrolase, PTH1 family
MPNPIHLIVGLGNPGTEYAETRHNAGAWLVELLAKNQHQTLRADKNFFGLVANANIAEQDCRLLIPTTFMNRSGKATQALAHFYRIAAENILVVHDELDLPVGTVRLKQGGGDGGHNGLRDISEQLGTNNYWRLRIGIGHPGERDRVHDYVLSKPSRADYQLIMDTIENCLTALPEIVTGEQHKAMQKLHTQK